MFHPRFILKDTSPPLFLLPQLWFITTFWLILYPLRKIAAMGRIFEKRKYKMFARFDRMAKAFTRIGKEISIAVKMGGALPENNPRLRMAIQNAKGANMPKDRVEAAIKRASSVEKLDYQEIVYEGYAPHGVPLLVECATDNPTRTVANVRLIFSKKGGSMGNSGSVAFMFKRKGVFRFSTGKLSLDELEINLIESGADDIKRIDDELIVYTQFDDFGNMQKYIEGRKIDVYSAELSYLPIATKTLQQGEQEDVLKLIETLEGNGDVQSVYHNLACI